MFVNRWSKGDLDDALSVLSEEEWECIYPWFEDAWNAGCKSAGLVLGNNACSKENYTTAIEYWRGCGMARGWYLVGRFYNPFLDKKYQLAPSYMQDETKARKAYEQCLRMDKNYSDALFALSFIYMFATKDENRNYEEAKNGFFKLLKENVNDEMYTFCFGLAGYRLLTYEFNQKWPSYKREKLDSWKAQFDSIGVWDQNMAKEYNRYSNDYADYLQSIEIYCNKFIRKAANMGCEPAKTFITDYDKKNSTPSR